MSDISRKAENLTGILRKAYSLFRGGDFDGAETVLEDGLALDYDHPEVLCALKCANFWSRRNAQLVQMEDDYEAGEFLLKQWKSFLAFVESDETDHEQGVFAVKQWVFGAALSRYLRLLESSVGSDPEILFRVGRCYKGKGNYSQALEYYEASSHQRTDDPLILAELADCYAFINEITASKAFFREAFFLDPQKVDLTSLESLMMQRLIQRVKEMGYVPPALAEWIPVYGVLFGVFNVKRELRSLEYGKLKQSIFSLESRMDDEGACEGFCEPRLINRYFWLIDHHIASGDSRAKIDEILQKLRRVSPDIYRHYTN